MTGLADPSAADGPPLHDSPTRVTGDPLSDFLDGPRARSAFHLRVLLRPPWSLRVEDEAPLTVMPVLAGSCWFTPDGESPIHVTRGDVLLVRAGRAYTLSSEAGTTASITIGQGQSCTGQDGRDLSVELASGPRTWGNDPDGPDRLLVGSYRSDTEVGRLLTAALPHHVVLAAPAPQLVDLLDAELRGRGAGLQSVCDRLLDLLLITCVRAWADEDDTRRTWLAAGRDEAVRAGLHLMHTRPEHPWTLDELAQHARLSRAAFARRFRAVVGEPPMTYLTRWRLARGADLVADGATLDVVARQVGYSSGFSFSAAFTRAYGISPAGHRRHRSRTA